MRHPLRCVGTFRHAPGLCPQCWQISRFLTTPKVVLHPRNAKAGRRSPPYWGLGTRSPGGPCPHRIHQTSPSQAIPSPSMGPEYRPLRWGCWDRAHLLDIIAVPPTEGPASGIPHITKPVMGPWGHADPLALHTLSLMTVIQMALRYRLVKIHPGFSFSACKMGDEPYSSLL